MSTVDESEQHWESLSCLQNVPMALNCAAVCYCALTHLMTYTAC